MMELTGAVLGVVLLWGAGALLSLWLSPAGSWRSEFSFGRAMLCGFATVGLALHVPLALDGRIGHVAFGTAALTCLVMTTWFAGLWWKRGPRRVLLNECSAAPSLGLVGSDAPRQAAGACARQPVRASLGGWIADLNWPGRLLVGIVIVAAFIHALRADLPGFDARTAFALKARMLYDTGDIRGEDFCDLQRVNFNPTYPLLLPLLEAEMYWLQGSYEHPGLKLLFLGFALALVSAFAAEVRRFDTPGLAAFAALLVLLTPMTIDCFEGAGLSGGADLPLTAFVFVGIVELSRWCAQPDWRRALAAALFLGAAATTKQEGFLWAAVGGVTALGLCLGRKVKPGWSGLACALPGVAVLFLALGLHAAVHRGMPRSPYYPSYAAAFTDWNWLRQLGDRPWQIFHFAMTELSRTGRWCLVWPCIIGAFVLLRRGPVPLQALVWRLVLVAMGCIYLATFVVTPLHLYYQLATTFSRLLMHLFPLAMLAMCEHTAAAGWTRGLSERPAVLPATEPRLDARQAA